MKELNLRLGGEGHMKPCRDHTGREFPSITAMAAAWGIPLHVLYNRRERDWPLDKALTTPVGHRKSGPAIDHTGKAYPSAAAMARAWGIDANTLHLRTRYKWPLEKALTIPLRRHFSPVVDPESGVTYTSRSELARALGVSPVTVYRRRCAGLPPELVVFSGKMSCTPARDHLGREYPSQSEMARAWGVRPGTYSARRAKNWDIERALTAPRTLGGRPKNKEEKKK